MMGGTTPETCWAVNKSQDNKLENCCIWLVIYLSCNYIYMCSWWWVDLPPETCKAVYKNIINCTQSHLVGQLLTTCYIFPTHKFYFCVPYYSQNKYRSFPQTVLTFWFRNETERISCDVGTVCFVIIYKSFKLHKVKWTPYIPFQISITC